MDARVENGSPVRRLFPPIWPKAFLEDKMTRFRRTATFLCCLAVILIPTANAGLVTTYTFDSTFAAQQPGVAPLIAVDPLGTSTFQTANVFGTQRNTWHFDGAASPPADQGGLQFNTTGLISPNNYSVEMVFELTGNSRWRRVMDSLDRLSDDGLYIDPSNNLEAYPVGGSSSPFSANTFFDVFITVDPSNTVTGYVSGVPQFSTTSNVLDVRTNFLGFFLDNTAGSGRGEWSSGNISLIKVFDTALTADQVAAETADPFQGTGVPEPGTWMLMLGGVAAAAIRKRLIPVK